MKIASACVVIGFIAATFSLMGAVHHSLYVLAAIPPTAASVALLRRHSWGGYGFALFELGQMLVLSLLTLGTNSLPRAQMASVVVVGFLMAILFLIAGLALSRAGAVRGLRWPWIALTAATTLPLLFVRAYVMPSGSMENTLLIGDRIFVHVFPRPMVNRGDVIVFHYPVDSRQIFVKRVIGLPGDRVHVKAKAVFVNGEALKEPYAVLRFPYDPFRDNLPNGLDDAAVEQSMRQRQAEMLSSHATDGDVVVPPGSYFVLGDNRDNSLDSRYWGLVAELDVIGEPFLIYDSEESSESALQVGTGKPGGTRTRWDRVFIRVQRTDGSIHIEKSGSALEISQEAAVLSWCADLLPVPRVIEQRPGMLLMSELPGTNLAEVSLEAAVNVLVEALRRIHAVPIEGCPFYASWDLRVRQAAQRAEAGFVDESDFDGENLGRSSADLLAELRSLPPREDEVCFTHGDACLPNFLSHEGRLSGIVDFGRAGITHPAQDWALALRSVGSEFGEEGERLLRRHLPANCDDEELLSRFRLLDEFF